MIIENAWDSYREEVVSFVEPMLDDDQLAIVRSAFFAGASLIFTMGCHGDMAKDEVVSAVQTEFELFSLGRKPGKSN